MLLWGIPISPTGMYMGCAWAKQWWLRSPTHLWELV